MSPEPDDSLGESKMGKIISNEHKILLIEDKHSCLCCTLPSFLFNLLSCSLFYVLDSITTQNMGNCPALIVTIRNKNVNACGGNLNKRDIDNCCLRIEASNELGLF